MLWESINIYLLVITSIIYAGAYIYTCKWLGGRKFYLEKSIALGCLQAFGEAAIGVIYFFPIIVSLVYFLLTRRFQHAVIIPAAVAILGTVVVVCFAFLSALLT